MLVPFAVTLVVFLVATLLVMVPFLVVPLFLEAALPVLLVRSPTHYRASPPMTCHFY